MYAVISTVPGRPPNTSVDRVEKVVSVCTTDAGGASAFPSGAGDGSSSCFRSDCVEGDVLAEAFCDSSSHLAGPNRAAYVRCTAGGSANTVRK